MEEILYNEKEDDWVLIGSCNTSAVITVNNFDYNQYNEYLALFSTNSTGAGTHAMVHLWKSTLLVYSSSVQLAPVASISSVGSYTGGSVIFTTSGSKTVNLSVYNGQGMVRFYAR